MISSRTPAASHFATLIFCWLPPDRLPTIWFSEGVRTSSLRMKGSVSVWIRRSKRKPVALAKRRQSGMPAFSSTE